MLRDGILARTDGVRESLTVSAASCDTDDQAQTYCRYFSLGGGWLDGLTGGNSGRDFVPAPFSIKFAK
jgi:hypothetical protein